MWTIKVIRIYIFFIVIITSQLLPQNTGASRFQDGEKKMLSYPYIADEYREKQIKDGYGAISVGMTCDEVKNIMGDPDEIYDLYESKNAMDKIGFTHWYILQRLRGSGSVFEKDEHLVRISYDLNGIVIRKDQW
jgi:hypothetical protein